MKKIFIFIVILSSAFSLNSFAQVNNNHDQLTQLLASYYSIKNALVAGNSSNAATAAATFVKAANGVDPKDIPGETIHTLVSGAVNISDYPDLIKQRIYFAAFSINMATVAKTVKLSEAPVYYDYCPMKKAYWLSSDKAIKNPYYGNSMLTCGKITETL